MSVGLVFGLWGMNSYSSPREEIWSCTSSKHCSELRLLFAIRDKPNIQSFRHPQDIYYCFYPKDSLVPGLAGYNLNPTAADSRVVRSLIMFKVIVMMRGDKGLNIYNYRDGVVAVKRVELHWGICTKEVKHKRSGCTQWGNLHEWRSFQPVGRGWRRWIMNTYG